MELPWKTRKKKLEELQEEIENLNEELEEVKEEKESYKNRYKAEKDRRSEVSAKKQEAERKLKKLKEKQEKKDEETKEKQEEKKDTEFQSINFLDAFYSLQKIQALKSPEKDLITVFKSGSDEIEDMKGLKNSVKPKTFQEISENEDFILFTDEKFIGIMLKARPFFNSEWSLGKEFNTKKMIKFIEKEKNWVLVSAGETKIFREQEGEFEEVERIKHRVNKKQKKGGFSQGRFERKRDEQIENHLDEVEEEIKNLENEVYLLGDRRLCEQLEGVYLGGFDSSRNVSANLFYNFQYSRL